MKRKYRVKLDGNFTMEATSPRKAREFVVKLIKNEQLSDKDFELEVSLVQTRPKVATVLPVKGRKRAAKSKIEV